MKYKLKLG